MSAKHKLNAAFWNGALITAGALGLATASFPVFAIALTGLLISSWHSGDIRLDRKP